MEIEWRFLAGAWTPCIGRDGTGAASVAVPRDATISGCVVFVRAYFGIPHLQFIFADCTRSSRVFPASDDRYARGGHREHVLELPVGETPVGIDARVQDRFTVCPATHT